MSVIVLGVSCFYLLTGLYSFSTHYAGAFIVISAYFCLFRLLVAIITNLQVTAFFIWVVFCSILIFSSRKYWWVNLICLILTIPILFFGTLFGSLPLKTVHSIIYNERAYHLNYIYDGDDEYGYYSLLQCDSLDISCQQLFNTQWDFPKIDRTAQISVDETEKEIVVTVEGKLIFQQSLE